MDRVLIVGGGIGGLALAGALGLLDAVVEQGFGMTAFRYHDATGTKRAESDCRASRGRSTRAPSGSCASRSTRSCSPPRRSPAPRCGSGRPCSRSTAPRSS